MEFADETKIAIHLLFTAKNGMYLNLTLYSLKYIIITQKMQIQYIYVYICIYIQVHTPFNNSIND